VSHPLRDGYCKLYALFLVHWVVGQQAVEKDLARQEPPIQA